MAYDRARYIIIGALIQTMKNWDSVYDSFDGSRLSVWREHPTPFFRDHMNFLRSEGVTEVLDAGCGDGRNLLSYAKKGFNVTGMDISGSAIRRCRENCEGMDNVKLLRADIQDAAFPAGSFDAIICDHVLVHIREPRKVIDLFRSWSDGYMLLEFTSTKDPLSKNGKEFTQEGVYFRLFTIGDVKELLFDLEIISIVSESFTDPYHGPGYIRKERHRHHSHYALIRCNSCR